MSRMSVIATLFASASLIGLGACQKPADQAKAPAASETTAEAGGYLPDPNRKYPERVLWGDEHVHTGWSVDAGVAGATLTPEDAVRFARGERSNPTPARTPSCNGRSTGWRSPTTATPWGRSAS